MPLESTEHVYLERQVTVARAVTAALSLVVLLETSGAAASRVAIGFLSAYLLVALAAALVGHFSSDVRLRIPLGVDFAVLAAFAYLTPSVSAFWLLLLFVVFALATRGNTRTILALVAVGTVGIITRVGVGEGFRRQSAWHWIAIGLGTLVSGLGMVFLGVREREHLARQQILEKITGVLRFDRGLAESVREALGTLTKAFECEQACLAVRDDDLERLFVWKIRAGDGERLATQTLPLDRCETFLLDSLEISMHWEFKNGSGHGFGWDRRTGQRFRRVPAPPASTQEEFGTQSLLAVTIESGGQPVGRVLLVNPRPAHLRFSEGDLRWLERVVRHMGPPLENLFLLRNLRSHTIESERSRISRDLHDGILQTLLSLKIQLEVLRQKLPQNAGQACADLTGLQKTIQQESEELRRMVTDMRPLRLESADMRELMTGFAERLRGEGGLAVDLFIEDRDFQLPDRLCRELFQIYRESLHNVKKHANASHVVVKLKHDETRVSLVVDDNGKGFSFSGLYTSEELDRLRLGPISIKERTRSVGGTLTVESNPGHGARLTVEIPIN